MLTIWLSAARLGSSLCLADTFEFATHSVHGERFATRNQAMSQLFEYIEVHYDRQRLHSSLGYLIPAEFELARVVWTSA